MSELRNLLFQSIAHNMIRFERLYTDCPLKSKHLTRLRWVKALAAHICGETSEAIYELRILYLEHDTSPRSACRCLHTGFHI